MSEVADLYVTLRARTAEFNRPLLASAAVGEAAASRIRHAAMGIGLGVAASLAAVGVAALKQASTYEASTLKFVTTAGESARGLELVRRGMLSMASQVGIGANQLSQAMYYVESGGFHAAAGLNILRDAAMAAQLEGSNVVDVAHALAGALNDYRGTTLTSASATNAMTAAVGAGMMTFQDLAEAMPHIGARAAAANVKFQEMLAGIATMTKDGLPAAVSATYLGQTIGQLSAPTAQATREMAALGLNSHSVALAITSGSGGGLAKAINMVWDASSRAGKLGQTQVQALAKMTGGVRSYQGALMLGGAHASMYASTLAAINAQLRKGGTAIAGWSDRQKTFQQQVADTKARMESWLITIGTALIPVATRALKAFNTALDWLGKHKAVLDAIAGGIAAVAAAGAGLAIFAVVTNPLTYIIGAIFALGAGLTYAYKHFAGFREIVKTVAKVLKEVLGQALHWIAHTAVPGLISAWHGLASTVSTVVSSISGWVRSTFGGIATFFRQHGAEIMAIFRKVWTIVAAIFTVYLKTIWALVKGIFTAIGAVLAGAVKFWWTVVKNGWHMISAVIKTALDVILGIVGVALDLLTGHWGKAWSDLKNLASTAWNDFMGMCSAFFNGLVNVFVSFGQNLVGGLVSGIKSAVGGAVNAVKSLGSSIASGFTGILGIHSPSRVFHGYGKNIVLGLIGGLKATSHLIDIQMADIGKRVLTTRHWVKGHGKHHKGAHWVSKQSWKPDHQLIKKIEDEFAREMQHASHTRTGLARWAHSHRTPAGRKQALAAWKVFDRQLLAIRHQMMVAKGRILHDPHATAGSKHRILTEIGQINKQILLANKLHATLLHEQIGAHKAAHHARHQSALKATAGDLPSYLEAAAAAGYTKRFTMGGTVATARGAHLGRGVPPQPIFHKTTIVVELDKREIGRVVQEHVLRHERRNASNGLSRRRDNFR